MEDETSPQQDDVCDDESIKSDENPDICNATLDMAVLDESSDEIKSIKSVRKRVSIATKRKSIDVIELSDDENDKPVDGKKKFKSDDIIELSTSPILITTPLKRDEIRLEKENEDNEEYLNEEQLLSLLNKTTPNAKSQKSVVRSPFASQCLGTRL